MSKKAVKTEGNSRYTLNAIVNIPITANLRADSLGEAMVALKNRIRGGNYDRQIITGVVSKDFRVTFIIDPEEVAEKMEIK